MAGEKILVVDDEPQVRKLLETFLVRSGFSVRIAEDGLQALERLREELADLVITDVTMPNLNGLELTRRLRASHKTARIPILMLSALKQEQDVLAGYAQGADDYVGKPIELTILRAKIDLLLRRGAAVASGPLNRPADVIAFMHGKGGVGATTLAVNTAVAMTVQAPERVSLLDLSLTFSNSSLLMDIRSLMPLTRLGEVRGNVDSEVFERFVSRHASGVAVVVANHVPEDTELVSVPAVQLAIEQLRDRSDQLIIDLPANFSEHTLAAIDSARLVCVVTTPRLPSMKAARDCLSVLGKIGYPAERVKIVVNFTAASGLAREQVVSFFKREPDAVIRNSITFDTAADAGRVLVTGWPESDGATDVRALSAMLQDALYDGPTA